MVVYQRHRCRMKLPTTRIPVQIVRFFLRGLDAYTPRRSAAPRLKAPAFGAMLVCRHESTGKTNPWFVAKFDCADYGLPWRRGSGVNVSSIDHRRHAVLVSNQNINIAHDDLGRFVDSLNPLQKPLTELIRWGRKNRNWVCQIISLHKVTISIYTNQPTANSICSDDLQAGVQLSPPPPSTGNDLTNG